jgi:hypothetical protein
MIICSNPVERLRGGALCSVTVCVNPTGGKAARRFLTMAATETVQGSITGVVEEHAPEVTGVR